MSVDGRYCKYSCIVYPESEPDYQKKLDSVHLMWVESPLHDRDVRDSKYDIEGTLYDGDYKKPHVHIMVDFGKSKKSVKQAIDALSVIGINYVVPVEHPKPLIRYFAHLDNPEKAQYNFNDIKCHGGACVDDYLSMSASERQRTTKDIMQWLKINKVTEYSVLVDFVYDRDMWDWEQILQSSSYVFINYLKSVRHGGFLNYNPVKFDENGELFND